MTPTPKGYVHVSFQMCGEARRYTDEEKTFVLGQATKYTSGRKAAAGMQTMYPNQFGSLNEGDRGDREDEDGENGALNEDGEWVLDN
jgi:hypothetical protein